MKSGRALAHQLALAAYRQAEAAGDLDATVKALETGAAVIRSSLTLRQVLQHPAIPVAKRSALLARLAPGTGTSDDLLRVLLDRRQLGLLGQIVRSVRAMVEARRTAVAVRVESASTLSKTDVARIREVMAAALKRPVTVSVAVRADVIGGLRIKAGELVVDGSVAGAFDRLAAQLAR